MFNKQFTSKRNDRFGKTSKSSMISKRIYIDLVRLAEKINMKNNVREEEIKAGVKTACGNVTRLH